MDILFSKRVRATLKPNSCVARYLVVKHSWRGAYRRLFCITPTEIFTQDPQQSLRVTNSYSIGPDADIDGLTIGPNADEFTLLARSDKKARKFVPLKFTCQQRTDLLTDLYQCIMGVTAIANVGLAFKLLSSAESFPCSRWSRKQETWQPVILQCACFQMVCMEPETGVVLWRALYSQLAQPHAITALASTSSLAPGAIAAQSAAAAANEPAPRVIGVFSVRPGGKATPHLLASPSRDMLMNVMRTQASRRLGLELTVDVSEQDGHAMLMWAAQTQQQVASRLCDSILAEWEVSHIKPRLDIQPVLLQLDMPGLLARPPPSVSVSSGNLATQASALGGKVVLRRLLLTPSHLLERKAGCYSLVRAHPLASIATLARCVEDPQLLAIEWNDGRPATMFLSAARDAILAALLDAAQAVQGTPIPILPGLTAQGDMVSGTTITVPSTPGTMTPRTPTNSQGALNLLAAASDTGGKDAVIKWMCDEVVGRARDAYSTLNTSSRMLFTADIDFRPSPYSSVQVSVLNSQPDRPVSPPLAPGPHQKTDGSTIAPNTPTASDTAVHAAAEFPPINSNAYPSPFTINSGSSGKGLDAQSSSDQASVSGSGSDASRVLSRGAIPPPQPPINRVSFYGADGLLLAGRGAAEPAAVREAVEVVLEAVADFNSSTPLSGVPATYKLDTTAAAALLALMPPELQAGLAVPPHLPPDDVKRAVLVLQCLQRFAASHQAAETILATPSATGRIFAAIACGEEHVAYEASRLLLRFLAPQAARSGAVPWRTLRGGMAGLSPTAGDGEASMFATHADVELSKSSKALLFPPSKLDVRIGLILAPLKRDRPPCSPLMSLAAVELVMAIVAEPGNATTDSKLLSTLLAECAALGRPLFALFHHPSARVADGVAVLMRAIAGSGTAAAAPMREAALREGAMLHHLLLAVAAKTNPRTLLSRDLVASWADEYAPALTLLRRVFPPGLVRYLNTPRQQPPAPVQIPTPSVQQQQGMSAQTSPAISPDQSQAGTTANAAKPASGSDITQSQGGSMADLMVARESSAGRYQNTPINLVPGRESNPGRQQLPAMGTGLSPQGVGGGGSQLNLSLTGTSPPGPGISPQASKVSLSDAVHGPTLGGPASNGSETMKLTATSAVPNGNLPSPAGSAQGTLVSRQSVGLLPALTVSHGIPAVQPVTTQQTALHMPLSGGLRGNWEALWAALGRDHYHAGLVWNESCRRELRDALQTEEAGLRSRRQQVAFQASGVTPVWNYTEFRVIYPSLAKHLCIGGIYIRLLLDGADTAAVSKIPNSHDLFQALQHHLLCSDSHLLHAHTSSLSSSQLHTSPAGNPAAVLQSSALSEVEAEQLLCVRAMTEVYKMHAGAVGRIDGLPHLIKLLDLSLRRPLRHNLLLLLQAALCPAGTDTSMQAMRVARANAACLVDEGGVELLVDIVASAHEALDENLAAICGPSSSTSAALPAAAATHLLTSTGHEGGAKEWWYYPNGIQKNAPIVREGDDDRGNGGMYAADEFESGPAVPDATGRVGPVSKADLLQLWRDGAIHGHTLCWAEGCAVPAPLAGIRELRWLVAGGLPVMSVQEASRLALQLLARLADMQPATDNTGSVLQPLPRVLRILSGPRCLPHIVQALLTRDPGIVSQAAGLLEVTLSHNEDALARLYRTGAFYYALSYAGSNWQELASLLSKAHLKQAHRGASASPAPSASLAARSYLGHMLPESLLYTLDSYGPQAFAAALCGESDTPELRWTHAMRWGRLLPQLAAHLGDFPQRLSQNWSGLVWQYTPAPPVTYPELKDELWCHRYYLKALCDEVSFPNWDIVDHVQLLQALLAEWRAELSRQPLALSESEACRVLGITPGPGGIVAEEDMRRAYRSMARRYHPDKNPAGRPMFMRVQQAYERLLAGATGGQGPQAWRIVLMLKAQAILFRRFKTILAPYKYAGYPPLLEVLSSLLPRTKVLSRQNSINMSAAAAAAASVKDEPARGAADQSKANEGLKGSLPSSGFFSQDTEELTQAACELCWRTVCASHLNADELARCGGVAIICSLFQRLCSAGLLREDTSPTSHGAIVATHLLRSIAGFAASEVARPQLASMPGLLADIVHCCMLQRAHSASEAALVAVGHLCASPVLQTQLLQVDIMAYLIPLLFGYDTTVANDPDTVIELPFTIQPLKGPPVTAATNNTPQVPAREQPGATATSSMAATAHSFGVLELPMVRLNEAKAHNLRAMLAAQALGRLAGVLEPPYRTPDCLVAQHALGALLTHGLAVRLRVADPRPLLMMLNSGQESAQVIWNTAMRDELLALMSDVRAGKGGHHASGNGNGEGAENGETAASANSSISSRSTDRMLGWKFSALRNELQVGGIFVRVYCNNPAVLPADVQGFCKALVRYLYDVFVTSANTPGPKHPSRLMTTDNSKDLSDCICVLRALAALLDAESRLLGLLASRSAVAPLVSALQVAQTHAFATAFPTPPSISNTESQAGTVAVSEQTDTITSPQGSATNNAQKLPTVEEETPAAQLTQATLLVMSRLVAHAGCLEAIADVNTVRLLFHTAHCAPSAQAMRQALGILQAVAGQPSAGTVAADQAGALLMLAVLLHPTGSPWPWPGGQLAGGLAAEENILSDVAALIARLMTSPTHGTAITVQMQRLLPPALVTTIATSQPAACLASLRGRVVNPELVWEPRMAQQAAAQLAVLAHQARTQQAAPGANPTWLLPAGLVTTYQQLEGELRVGGVYCRLFLKDPQFPLKEPLRFGEGLAQALVAALSPGGSQGGSGSGGGAKMPASEVALLLSASLVALLKHHHLVADNLVSQGYVPRFVSLLAARLPPPAAHQEASQSSPKKQQPQQPQQPQTEIDEGGAILRLLHALSATSVAAESLATIQGAVSILMGACAWGHTAEVLVLETLKRVLGPANRSRDTLVNQALQVGLVPTLLFRLDWQSSGDGKQTGDADMAVLRALAVDVLSELCGEGAASAQAQALLDQSPIWAAYRNQRHDLFLPSGAAVEGSVAGLLGPGAAQFALPAPERLNSTPSG